VVAHEFSHILNGDMRLNIRLIGLIFGIMALTVIGRVLMWQTAGRRASASQGDSGSGRPILGLGLFVPGLVGAFFGRLIQAAVSRQREYLADAGAVQFTRNPDGIAGALKIIGGLKEGSHIDAPAAAEVARRIATGCRWWTWPCRRCGGCRWGSTRRSAPRWRCLSGATG
jgi:Zn-dependent protease with chaperone function